MKSQSHRHSQLLLVFLIVFSVLAIYGPKSPAQARQLSVISDTYYFFVPLAFNNYSVPSPQFPTGILDIDDFLEKCPQNDPVYAQLTADFQVRIDGEIVTDIPCSEPVSAMPAEQKTYELRTLQAFRVAYYLDPHVPNYLPWTSQNLYDWLKGNVSGVNFKTTSESHYCCQWFDGKPYISTYFQNGDHTIGDLSWPIVSGGLFFYAHEARHQDPDDPGHVEGCAAFPTGSGIYGCDYEYNESNLGAYGVQRWLHWAFAGGHLNIGIACSPNAYWYVSDHVSSANGYAERFVTNIPAPLPMPSEPYGGPCLVP